MQKINLIAQGVLELSHREKSGRQQRRRRQRRHPYIPSRTKNSFRWKVYSISLLSILYFFPTHSISCTCDGVIHITIGTIGIGRYNGAKLNYFTNDNYNDGGEHLDDKDGGDISGGDNANGGDHDDGGNSGDNHDGGDYDIGGEDNAGGGHHDDDSDDDRIESIYGEA